MLRTKSQKKNRKKQHKIRLTSEQLTARTLSDSHYDYLLEEEGFPSPEPGPVILGEGWWGLGRFIDDGDDADSD